MIANKYKVLYILNDTTPFGGANKSFLNFLLTSKQYIDPIIIVPDNNGICSIFRDNNIKYYTCKLFIDVFPNVRCFQDFLKFTPKLIRQLYFNSKAFYNCLRLIKKHSIKIIHTNVGPLYMGHFLAKSCGIPHIWHIREYQNLDFSWTPLLGMKHFKKMLHENHNYPITISNDLANHFDLSQSLTIYNGICPEATSRFFEEKRDYLLYAGRTEKGKGIEDLLYAYIDYSNNHKNPLPLKVAGSTANLSYLHKLKRMSKSVGDRGSIEFLGMRNDIDSLMYHAKALIVPSYCEGFGRITVEAIYNGCLVIGRNTGGTKEILESDSIGMLFSNQLELTKCIEYVTTVDSEEYRTLVLKAQNIARIKYSVEEHCKGVIKFYDEVYNKNYD